MRRNIILVTVLVLSLVAVESYGWPWSKKPGPKVIKKEKMPEPRPIEIQLQRTNGIVAIASVPLTGKIVYSNTTPDVVVRFLLELIDQRDEIYSVEKDKDAQRIHALVRSNQIWKEKATESANLVNDALNVWKAKKKGKK